MQPHLFIDAAASIYRWPHLFIDAAASIYRWPHLFIDAALSIYRCGYLLIDAAIYKIEFLRFNLLSNGLIEKFWDALWLGIGPVLCFICTKIDFLKLNLLSNELIEILGRLVVRYRAVFV